LERHQAVALLKEIFALELTQPTGVYVRKSNGEFELVLQADCSQALQKFVAEKGLTWRLRKDMGVCVIYKSP
jgi:hypothetical protein